LPDKLIITVAPTGNVPTKEMNPATPLTPAEIADDIAECARLGASVAHIHARSPDGLPTQSRDVYAAILDELASRDTGVITMISTGARGGGTRADERGAGMDLGCEMASLATGSSNFPDRVNANPPDVIEALARRMRECGVKPEIECFDVAMISNAAALAERGLLDEPLHFNMVMGVPGSIPATERNLEFMVESIPPGSTWCACAIGRAQVPILTAAIGMGGHARTGLEDTLLFEKGVPATNAMLVERVVQMAHEAGREVASPDEARIMLGLRPAT